MAGNQKGGFKTRDKILARNPRHYIDAGARGGKALVPKGFALMDRATHKAASIRGGTISRRTKSNHEFPEVVPTVALCEGCGYLGTTNGYGYCQTCEQNGTAWEAITHELTTQGQQS